MNRRETGTQYEAVAARFLEKNGEKILERNFRCRFGEIDLIAMEGNTVCFVEVKYRKTADYGYGCEAVDLKKQKTIIEVSEYYLMTAGLSDAERRYDVVEILGNRIRVLKNCFGG